MPSFKNILGPRPLEFIMDWGSSYSDKPYPDGQGFHKRIFPRFDPLAKSNIPRLGIEQDIFFDLIARAVILHHSDRNQQQTRDIRRTFALFARILVNRLTDETRDTDDAYRKLPDIFRGKRGRFWTLVFWLSGKIPTGIYAYGPQGYRTITFLHSNPLSYLDLIGEAKKYNWEETIIDDLQWLLDLDSRMRQYIFQQIATRDLAPLEAIHFRSPGDAAFHFYPEDLRGILTERFIRKHRDLLFEATSTEDREIRDRPYPQNHPRSPEMFTKLPRNVLKQIEWRPVRVFLKHDNTTAAEFGGHRIMNHLFTDICEYAISRVLPNQVIRYRNSNFLPVGPHEADIRHAVVKWDAENLVYQADE